MSFVLGIFSPAYRLWRWVRNWFYDVIETAPEISGTLVVTDKEMTSEYIYPDGYGEGCHLWRSSGIPEPRDPEEYEKACDQYRLQMLHEVDFDKYPCPKNYRPWEPWDHVA